MPGQQLNIVWSSMSDEQKKKVAKQIGAILTAIRELPYPEQGMIGSCDGTVARDCRRIHEYDGAPFADEEGFNDFIFDVIDTAPMGIQRAMKKNMRTDHRIVFSHGDLSQHNFLVDEHFDVTALLDWEFAGWYPEYWDYVKFFERRSLKDWKEYADDIFDHSYDDELAIYQAICRWQRP